VHDDAKERAGPSSVAVVFARASRTTVRGAYAVMEQAGWWVLLPLSVASAGDRHRAGFGYPVGVLRHYWVVVELASNVVATVVLVMYMQTLVALADDARWIRRPLGAPLRSSTPAARSCSSCAPRSCRSTSREV
jgi:hypothetical protein